MVGHRRYLVTHALAVSREEDFLPAQEAALAACPEAARITDEEAEDFWAAARYLDWIGPDKVARSLQQARIPYPPDLTFDGYRLGRYLFRRWGDPDVREAFLERGMSVEFSGLARLRRERDVSYLAPMIDDWGSPAVVRILRCYGMADLIPAYFDLFTEVGIAEHRALLLFAKLTMHRFLTEPEPARTPSPWELRKLSRRLRLREVQVRSMRGSLRKLGRERTLLLGRLRNLSRGDRQELDTLATELAQLRTQRAALEQQHTAAMEEQAARHRETLARLRAELSEVERDLSETLAVRRSWLPASRR